MIPSRAIAIALVISGISGDNVVAQTPPTAVGEVMSPKAIREIAKGSRVAHGADQMVSTTLFSAPPYRVNLEHRITGDTPPSIHERNAEMFFVIDGEGVFILGGSLVDPVRRNSSNLSGASITGGQSLPVSKGDVVFVPAGLPHQITQVKRTLTMVATHLPNVEHQRQQP